MARMHSRRRGFRGFAARSVGVLASVAASYYGLCTLLLLLYAVLPPPITGVQLQRSVEYFFDGEPVAYAYQPVPASEISNHLRHALIAAEDGRFFEHGGIDWQSVQKAIEDNRRRGRVYRGGSTISQQLVKNLFMTTHSSFVRKVLEVPLTYLAELILSKDRILTLYLNVIEWDRRVYGAEAAARRYYGVSAGGLSRYQSAALASVVPNPRARSPESVRWYADLIRRRMGQMGY